MKAIPSSSGPPASGSTISFRCFSPTSRCCRIRNLPSKVGSGNACPHGPPSRSSSAVSSESSCIASSPSDQITPSSIAGSSHSPTKSPKRWRNSSNLASSSDNPAAIAWPPNFIIKPGLRVSSRSSASRMCKPATERPEPFKIPSPAGANAITGR
ncbi:hypothetical protein D3C79_881150 [compost metagenome]